MPSLPLLVMRLHAASLTISWHTAVRRAVWHCRVIVSICFILFYETAVGLLVSAHAIHACNPGSIPGWATFFNSVHTQADENLRKVYAVCIFNPRSGSSLAKKPLEELWVYILLSNADTMVMKCTEVDNLCGSMSLVVLLCTATNILVGL